MAEPADALVVEEVDFVSFLTQDIPRAKRFYAETLGLEIETEGEHDMEFRLGQVTLDVFNPESQGQPFAPNLGGVAIRVPDVAAAISPTARSNASAFAWDGFVKPLTLRTYCSAAPWTSSSVAGGSKLNSVWMFRHMWRS